MGIKKKKGFTLIELVAVLVILAIIALIVTPLVMSIIRKAKIAADKRSVDAYGRSIELAIAEYLMDTGDFPTSINQLTIEYSGDEVVCTTTQLNGDSSVYLAGCTVGGRSVDGYTYGKEETITYDRYEVGDEVSYNNVDYYVIADSDANETSVTLLKKDPLTVAQVNQFGTGHVNMNVTTDTSASYYQQAYNINYMGTDTGIGGMAYYSSATCNGSGDSSGCTTNYADSEIKYVVDAWKTAQAPNATNARLITLDDLTDNLGMELNRINPTSYQITVTEDTPTWVMGENYGYWTMTTNTDKTAEVWRVYPRSNAFVFSLAVFDTEVVRPVITLSKTTLVDEDESIVDNTDNDDKGDNIQSENKSSDDKKETTTKLKVGNTYMRQTLIIMIIGFISICSGVVIYYIIKNKKIISRR